MESKTPMKAKKSLAPQISCVVNIRGIQKNNLPYIFVWIIYYAWFFFLSIWWTASPLRESWSNTELRVLLNTVNLISTGILIFIVQKEWYFKTISIGVVLAIVGICLFLMVPNFEIQLLCTFIIGTALGIINASILLPFVFTLNNTEKLYTVVGSNVLIGLISLLQEFNGGNYLQTGGNLLLSSVILVIALSASVLFKKTSLSIGTEISSIDTPTFHSRIYLTLFFNCVIVILCKGVGNGILNISTSASVYPILIWYYLGNLAGCIVYFSIYALLKKPFVWLGNITFGFFAMGLFFNAFTIQNPKLVLVFAFLLGTGTTVGIINMFYIIGIVGKKYNSIRYIRLSVLIIGMFGGVSSIVVGGFIHSKNTFEVSMISSIVSVTVMLLFIMLSSVVSQSQYYDDWAKDSEKTEIDNEQTYMFRKYRLSKREIEVCKLLLQGYTLRQISGILSIAYSTVNTYCTSVYRKLEINSRTELILLFKDYISK